jgi:ketosteroid isomerase-like protein
MDNIQTEKFEIEQLIKRVEAAENKHDVDAMLEDMTDDPLLHICGVPPVMGQDAVRQLYHEFFKAFVSTNITSQQIYVSSSGDMAWEYGSYINELQGPDGRIKEVGKYIGIYHKVDGKWKGAVYCITPNG